MNYKAKEEFVCIAEMKAKAGCTDELLQLLSALIPLSKAEKGCLRYEFHQSLEDPSVFVFVDRFKDEAAFNTHCEKEYITTYFDDLLPKLTEYIKISTYRELVFG